MTPDERSATEYVLRQIPRDAWTAFRSSPRGELFHKRLNLVRTTLAAARIGGRHRAQLPSAELLDMYGARLMSDANVGPWLRQILLARCRERRWERLCADYVRYAGDRAHELHGNMGRERKSAVMAEYWRVGGNWPKAFCETMGLPACLAEAARGERRADEDIWPADPLPSLHDFQDQVYRGLRGFLKVGAGTAMLSLPTGAGKTRVAVEAICDQLAQSDDRSIVLWIAQSEELQSQAWECFRQVWQVPPQRGSEQPISRTAPLRIVRAWGGRSPDQIISDGRKTVIIAGIQQLHSWVENRPGSLSVLGSRSSRLVVVIDEAHGVIGERYRDVFVALGLRQARAWKHPSGATAVLGLTATPWRSDEGQDTALRSYFSQSLLRPQVLGPAPIITLQERKILAKVQYERLRFPDAPKMTGKQTRELKQFHKVPGDYLFVLGDDTGRNAMILERLLRLPRKSKVMVFACSVEHAKLLAVLINSCTPGGTSAAAVTADTPRTERAAIIDRFRDGSLRFLCNVGVLTAGFDAPKADVVVMTRPTCSAVLYEQMVGRGLRGPKNGGTASCLIIDVQDDGLPDDIQSYARVVQLWDGTKK